MRALAPWRQGWTHRLGAMGLAIACLTATGATAQTPRAQISAALPDVARDDFLEVRTFAIRPDHDDGVTVSVFTPQYGQQTGAAVIVAPGGGYISLAGSLEGRQVADWFAARGVTAFVLRYRQGADHPLPEPIEDGERAVRFVRANAEAFGIDTDRIGMIGFSAGGHLAAMTTRLSDPGDPAAADRIERVSSRPDFLILAYPWLQATAIDARGGSAYCRFAKIARWDCRPQDYVGYTPLPGVADQAPPTFIYHTTDDGLVPVQGSVDLYQALATAGVDVEMHLFAHGPHGSGLGGRDPSLSLWPQALDAWLRAKGYLAVKPEGEAR
ncbi:MAG: alpha/beta hydrolase [Brevundimonas sp.]|uniref:alpha/beta hydrolase n=1 Tax=Brevundimonas sp. TaxID=1871086 RepID=UPI0028D8EBBC|nr:alpha/beta hydrolase [uncultured Brevundimonas sp.]